MVAVSIIQTLSPVSAEEDIILHSLDELPSSQINIPEEGAFEDPRTTKGAPVTPEILEKKVSYEETLSPEASSLLAAKRAFETEQQNLLSLPSLSSILDENTHLWGVDSLSPFNVSETFQKMILESFLPEVGFSHFQNRGVFPSGSEKQFRVINITTLGDNTNGIFAKRPIKVRLLPDTLIQTVNGTDINPADIGIYETDTATKIQANAYHDKKTKKRGTSKKGISLTESDVFDFGIQGTHLIFSKPVEISISTPNFSDGIVVDIATLHAGDASFHTKGLSSVPTTGCNPDGTATIPGSNVTVKNGKITFYTCGASSYTMNPTGGGVGSNDLRMVIGDCGQFQLYYNGTANMYTGNPPATGCNTALDNWIALRIGGTTYGSDWTAWTSNGTIGSQSGNTYSGTTNLVRRVGGRNYSLMLNWVYTAPNKYFNINWSMTIPTGNTNNVRFYLGNDSTVGGADANDVGYSGSAPSQTIGVYDNVLDQLSAIRYISGRMWTAGEAGVYTNIRTRINGGTDFNNTIQGTPGDLGFGVDWNLGTTPGTYTGTLEWRLAPYVAGNVPDVISGIGQPTPNLTVGQVSTLPMSVTNVGNASSTGVHTLVMGIPNNILGPSSPFTDNGWSCGAQIGTGVTCTKTMTLSPLVPDTVNIPVIPEVAASGTTVRFTALISNTGDSDTTNNSSYVDLQVVVAPAPPDTTPPVVTGVSIASGSLIPSGDFSVDFSYYDTGSNINVDTTTGAIYSWNIGTSSWNTINLAPSYMTITSSTTSTGAFQVNNLPYGKYRFDFSTRDNQGNTSTGSYTYFVDAIEWTVSADTYTIGDIFPNTNSFGTGELLITIRTVGAGFTLTNIATSTLITPATDTINYWNGTLGWGYDQWSGGVYSGNITSHSPVVTLANIAKSINPNGEKNTFTYRIKYGANVSSEQVNGDYVGVVGFGLNLTY